MKNRSDSVITYDAIVGRHVLPPVGGRRKWRASTKGVPGPHDNMPTYKPTNVTTPLHHYNTPNVLRNHYCLRTPRFSIVATTSDTTVAFVHTPIRHHSVTAARTTSPPPQHSDVTASPTLPPDHLSVVAFTRVLRPSPSTHCHVAPLPLPLGGQPAANEFCLSSPCYISNLHVELNN
jgi:hypothetical protein